MLDNLKLITYDQSMINRLAEMQGFERYQHRNNNYAGFCKYGKLMRLDFRKSFEKGVLVGYRHLEISISPHYHSNNYLHNGNDFTPENSIRTIIDILTYLKIEPQEYEDLKVVNFEFGLNLIPEVDVKDLIDGLLFYKKTAFKAPNKKTPYFRITDATKYKILKAYAKGRQFADRPQYGIDVNTYRFEVKSKKSANIKKYGIDKVTDLLNIEIYQRLGQELLNEWENVLLLNQTPDFSNLKPEEVAFIQTANKKDFWSDLRTQKHRNTFQINKEKYYNILKGKNNLHSQIKRLIIDKLIHLSKCANFPQKTPINREKDQNGKVHPKEINGQSAHFSKCLVTKLDISMQRKGSKFLCFAGLKYYKENDPETYKEIELKYLTQKMKTRTMEDQIYYIAHNIRNKKTNPTHNPKYSRQRFEYRNYHPNQIQINF